MISPFAQDELALPDLTMPGVEPMKKCRTCGESKPLSSFHKASVGHRGKRRSECKACALKQAATNRRPPRKRAGSTYCSDCGVTLTDENAYRRSESDTFRSRCITCLAMRRRQAHDRAEERRRAGIEQQTCEICGAAETVTRGGKVRRPTMDHNHKTGVQRGILCSRCNTGLGMYRDNPELLRAAADYLDKYGYAAEPIEVAA